MTVSRSIDAGIVHGFRSISATRSEIPLGRGCGFGLGILFDSERSQRNRSLKLRKCQSSIKVQGTRMEMQKRRGNTKMTSHRSCPTRLILRKPNIKRPDRRSCANCDIVHELCSYGNWERFRPAVDGKKSKFEAIYPLVRLSGWRHFWQREICCMMRPLQPTRTCLFHPNDRVQRRTT